MKTQKYDKILKKHEVKPNYLKNMLTSFFFGGLICTLGQALTTLYIHKFELVKEDANLLMLMTIILTTSILTGLGVYDNFGQLAKAGSFVPITGFANSLTSAALESRSEGIVLGIATNLFKLAGAVIVFAVVSAYIFGMIRYALIEFGVIPGPKEITGTLIYWLNVLN